MSTEVQMDDYSITSQNPDAAAVRADLAEPPAGAPAEPSDDEQAAAAAPVEAVTAPPSEDEPPADGTAPAGQPRDPKGQFAKKGKPSLQDRLAHTTWEREEARRENARLQAQLDALRTTPPAAPPPAQPPPATPGPASDGKPDLADYDTHEEWADALVAWHMAQRDKRDAAAAEEQRAVSVRRTYAEREEAYAAVEPGYRDAMARVATVPISASLRDAILGSERGPALAYYLATHPEEATGLIQQTWTLPTEAAPLVRQLLEAKLPATPASSGSGGGARHVVPPPISPVGASPVVADPVDINDLPPDEYVEAANAREFAERKKRMTLRA